jgi:hypothetical protein
MKNLLDYHMNGGSLVEVYIRTFQRVIRDSRDILTLSRSGLCYSN